MEEITYSVWRLRQLGILQLQVSIFTIRLGLEEPQVKANCLRVWEMSYLASNRTVSYWLTMRLPSTLLREMVSYQVMEQILIKASLGKSPSSWLIFYDRNYNEDRVAIILNIMKPKSKEGKIDHWPKCSFFGIYDGHGGNQCAEFLRDYLHQFVS
jgi:hypothetical protein